MASKSKDIIASLRLHTQPFLERSYVPYSKKPRVVLLLLSDGAWVAGVRVENASYSLVIPAEVNAFSTAAALGRHDVVAAVANTAFEAHELLFLQDVLARPINMVAEDAIAVAETTGFSKMGEPLIVFNPLEIRTRGDGIKAAREAAIFAHTPASSFPVGCVMVSKNKFQWQGCNVESSDWQRIICAERNAIGTAVTYGFEDWSAMYISCPKDVNGTPCGACRQVMVEFAPNLEVVIDRGDELPSRTTPQELLPHSFSGAVLKQ